MTRIKGRSLGVAVVCVFIIVIFFAVAFLFLFLFVLLIWLLSKDELGGCRPITRV